MSEKKVTADQESVENKDATSKDVSAQDKKKTSIATSQKKTSAANDKKKTSSADDKKKTSTRSSKKKTASSKNKKQTATGRKKRQQQKLVAANSWVVPSFLTAFLLGVLWLVLYYIASPYIPFMIELGNWNLAIGIGLMAVAMGIMTQWK